MSSNEPSSSSKKDADIQTQIVCGAEKVAPESPTKDAGVQTQFTFDPQISDSGIIPEIQTQDPKHSDDKIEVVDDEEEAIQDDSAVSDLEPKETEEETAAEAEETASEQNPEEVDDAQYQTADEGDEENHDFMVDEVDAAEVEAESAEDEVSQSDQPTAEIETQTAMMLGVDSVGIMSPLKCLSAGIQTVFTYDINTSVTNIKKELLTTHPRHSTDVKDETEAVAEVDDTSGEVENAEAAPDEEPTTEEEAPAEEEIPETVLSEVETPEVSPTEEEPVEATSDEEVADTENEIDLGDQTAIEDEAQTALVLGVSNTDDEEDNQRTAEIEAQTSLILGVGSTIAIKGQSVGIQTVFTYDLDRSMTSIKKELLKTLPRHSTDVNDETEALADVDGTSGEVENDEASPDEEATPVEEVPAEQETPEEIPTVEEAPEASPVEEETPEEVSPEEESTDAVPDEEVADTENEIDSDDQKAIEDEAETDLVLGVRSTDDKEENQKTAEIEVQTSVILGVGSTPVLRGQTVGMQTVFTYELDRSITSIKTELLKALPRHSADVKDETEALDDVDGTSGEVVNDEAPPDEEATTAEEVPAEEETPEDAPSEEEAPEAAPVIEEIPEDVSTEEETPEEVSTEEGTPEEAPSVEETADSALTEEETAETPPNEEVADTENEIDLGDQKETEVEAQTDLVLGVRNTDDAEGNEKTREIEAQTSLILGVACGEDGKGQSVGIQTVFTYDLDRSMTSIKRELLNIVPRHSIDVKDGIEPEAENDGRSAEVENEEDISQVTPEDLPPEEETPEDAHEEEETTEAAPVEEETFEDASTEEVTPEEVSPEEETPEEAPTEEATADTAPTEEETADAAPDEEVAETVNEIDLGDQKEKEGEAQTDLVFGVRNTDDAEENENTREIEAQTSLILGVACGEDVKGQSVGIQTVFTYDLDRSMTSIKKELLNILPRHSIDVKDEIEPEAEIDGRSGEVENAEDISQETPEDAPTEEETPEDAPTEEETFEAAPVEEDTFEDASTEEQTVEAVPDLDVADTENDIESVNQEETDGEAQTDLVLGLRNTDDAEENQNSKEIEAQTSLILGVACGEDMKGQSVGIQTVFTYDLDRSMTSIKRELLNALPRHSTDVKDEMEAVADVDGTSGEVENTEAPPDEEATTAEETPTEEETPEDVPTEEETAEAAAVDEIFSEEAPVEEENVEAGDVPTEEEITEDVPTEEETTEDVPVEEETAEATSVEEESAEDVPTEGETAEAASDGGVADNENDIESVDQKATESEAQTNMAFGIRNTTNVDGNQKASEIEVQTSLILGVGSTAVMFGQSVGMQTVFTYDLDRSDTSIGQELLNALPRHSIDVKDDIEGDVDGTSGEVENAESPLDEEEIIEEDSPADEETPDDAITEEETEEDAPINEETAEDAPTEEETVEAAPIDEPETADAAPAEEDIPEDASAEGDQSTADKDSHTSYILGEENSNVPKRQSVGVQTVFTYELDRSMTSIKRELLTTLPLHSTDNLDEDAKAIDSVEETDGQDISKANSEQESTTETALDNVNIAETLPEEEGASTWEEDIAEASLGDVDTGENAPPDMSEEMLAAEDTAEEVIVGTPSRGEVSDDTENEILPEDQKASEIEGVSAGTQTVFTYDVDTATANIKDELQKTHPKHSIELSSPDGLPSMQEAGIQTAFTYDINDSDTNIRNELLTSLPNHSTEVIEDETVSIKVDENENLDNTPEGSVSSGEDELETRSVDPTHSKASDWLPESEEVEDIVDDSLSPDFKRPSREDSHESVDDTAQPLKLINLKIQIESGVGHKPINMEISIVPPRRDRKYSPADASMGDVKEAGSMVNGVTIEDDPFNSEMINNKREAEAQTNMAFETNKNESGSFDDLPSPPNNEPALTEDQRELLESASMDQYDMVPMFETDLLVTPDIVPKQYVSTQVPLSDENCASAEDMADMKNRYFSDKAMIEEASKSGNSTLDPKKDPVPLAMQDIDYEHWGFPYAVNMRYEKINTEFSTVSDLSGYPVHKEDARSHLDRLDRASSIGSALEPTVSEGGVSTTTRVIFQIQSKEGESKSFDGRQSTVKNQVAFQMKIPTDENSEGERNQVRFVLQYGKHEDLVDDVATSPSFVTSHFKTNNLEKKMVDGDRSMHIATVELRESSTGDLNTHVHYNEGEEKKMRALVQGGSPLEITIPIGRESDTEIDNLPTTVHRMRLVVEQEGDQMIRESVTILEGAAPVTINIPVGDGVMGIALTANIVNGHINYMEEKPVEPEVIKPKPVRCTVITNGVPGETFEHVMEPSGSPLFFFLPMAEGPVRARLAIVPREPLPEPPRPTRARSSRLKKGTAITCQVVNDGVQGEELTKSLLPGGLPLHLDIPLNMGLTAKILIPHETELESSERKSDGDCCRDRAYETVADALATYEQGIQPLKSILDEICEKIKALNVPELARIGEPPDQPYLDFNESEMFPDCSCSMLVPRGDPLRSSKSNYQSPQRDYSPRNSRDYVCPDCYCNAMSSPRLSPHLSPQQQYSNNLIETYSRGSPRSNKSSQGSRRSSLNHSGGYEQNDQFGSRPQSGQLSPLCEGSCSQFYSASKECGCEIRGPSPRSSPRNSYVSQRGSASPLREESCSIYHTSSKDCEICGHRCPSPRSSPRNSYGSQRNSGSASPKRDESCSIYHTSSKDCEICGHRCPSPRSSPRGSNGSPRHSGVLTPVRNRSCPIQHSDSQECEHCCRVCATHQAISPLAQMYITLSQPRIASSDRVSQKSGSQGRVSYEPNESRGRCEDFYDEFGLACRRRGTGPPPTWRGGTRAPDPGCTVRGRCQTCGSSKIEMLPPPLQLTSSCGCDAIVPFETALVPIQTALVPMQKAVTPVSSRPSSDNQLAIVNDEGCRCKQRV